MGSRKEVITPNGKKQSSRSHKDNKKVYPGDGTHTKKKVELTEADHDRRVPRPV